MLNDELGRATGMCEDHQRRLGYLTGSIVLSDDAGRYDLRDMVWIEPQHQSGVTVVENHAKFVLLIEKRGIFDRLIKTEFHKKHDCLLACGNGYPGRSFHRVLRSLHDQLAIPFYVLADNDPGGIFFFFLIARGVVRRRSKPDKSIAIRDACFLGLRTEDPARIGLADIVHINLSENEITQLLQLKTTGWIASRTQWLREIEQLQARGTKVEVEALGVLSLSYLAETFLPNRLASGDGLRLQLPWVLNAQHYRNWFLQI